MGFRASDCSYLVVRGFPGNSTNTYRGKYVEEFSFESFDWGAFHVVVCVQCFRFKRLRVIHGSVRPRALSLRRTVSYRQPITRTAPLFRLLVHRYISRIFPPELEPRPPRKSRKNPLESRPTHETPTRAPLDFNPPFRSPIDILSPDWAFEKLRWVVCGFRRDFL